MIGSPEHWCIINSDYWMPHVTNCHQPHVANNKEVSPQTLQGLKASSDDSIHTPFSQLNDIKHQQYASNHFQRHIQRHSSMFLLILQEACGAPCWVMGLVCKEHAGNFREDERSAGRWEGRRRGANLRSTGGKSSGYRSKLHNGQEGK